MWAAYLVIMVGAMRERIGASAPRTMNMALLFALVAGVGATGWHFLGCSLVLTAAAGWMSRRMPGALSTLLFIAGALAMFVYAIPDLEGFAAQLMLAGNLWQGWLLWTSGRRALQSSRRGP